MSRAMSLLGVVTLVGTILESRRGVFPNWENNPVPLLLIQDGQHHGVLDDEQEETRMKVRLYNSGDNTVLGISQ